MKRCDFSFLNFVLIFFVILSLVLFVCIVLDAFCCKAIFGFNQSEHGATFSNWFDLSLSVINIIIMIFINRSVQTSSERLNERAIIAEKNKLKAELRYERFCKFRKDWQFAYENLQGGTNKDNQNIFDYFKSIYTRYIGEDSLLENSVNSLEVVLWWNKELADVDTYFKTHADFDANEKSYKWDTQRHELYAQLLENMFEPVK